MNEQRIEIRSVLTPGEGALSFFEAERDFPFSIKRLYYIYEVSKGVQRGGHAHKQLRQMLFCPYGGVLLKLDDGFTKEEILLDQPN